ncbi:MAG: DUF362 domain-containing protein [Candidatus Binatia bacterium]
MTVSRRSLFFLAILLLASFILFRWRTTIRNLVLRPEAKGQIPPKFPNPFLEGNKTLVGLVHGEQVELMVREAIQLIGGIEKLQVRGKTVLVKPNVVAGRPSPTTTNPEVIRAIIRILKEAGAKKVYVGDMSAILTLPTKRNMEKTGILKVVEDEGAEALFFEDGRWVKVDLSESEYIKEAYVSEWIYNVDRVINLPVIKTHRSATYSIALKNFIGATHGRQRPYLVDSSHWEEIVSEFNLAYQPHLNLVDGTKVMLSGGPWSGSEAESGIVLASGDRVATDIIGLSLIKHYGKDKDVARKGVWEQKQIQTAVRLGLGVKDSSSLLLKEKSLKGPDSNFTRLVSSIRKHAFGNP